MRRLWITTIWLMIVAVTHAADDGYFVYDAGPDPFRDDAALDLRYLNEPFAGQSGFVRRDGDRFTLGDGTPVRFWGVNIGAKVFEQPDDVLAYMARRLAKLGVNMVRLHGAVFDESDPTRVSATRLDGMQRTVAALRLQGIYTTLSFYFPVWMKVTPSTGLNGYDAIDNKHPFGLIYFNPRMQAIYDHWLTTLLTAPNPHTGVPLGRDPAVAMVELVNEDSLLFWTLSKRNIPAPQWSMLETQFGAWLNERDGGKRDRAELFEAWHITRQGQAKASASRRARIGEQVRFLSQLQRLFHERTTRRVRDELGYRGLIVAGNWTTADNQLLDPLERYSYTVGDVIDQHGYVDRMHEGEAAAWSVRVGHLYGETTTLGDPAWAPLRVNQIAGFPHILSEVGWTNPSPYRAESTALLAAYASLQGIDGVYLFAVTDPTLVNTSVAKFALGCPVVAGTFPAAALMYRRGDVREAEVVVRDSLQLSDLYALKGQASAGESALDAFRAADVPPGASLEAPVGSFDSLSYFVGRVTRSIDSPDASMQRNLTEHIRRTDQTLKSLTGELAWGWGRRVVTIHTPRCVAAVGFLKDAGPIVLGDVTIHCNNAYASIFVLALDDKPIAESRKLLIQAMTRERLRGFATEPVKNSKGEDRLRIVSLGVLPFEVEKVDANVVLPGEGWNAMVLNGHGEVASNADTGGGVLQLSADAVYTVAKR